MAKAKSFSLSSSATKAAKTIAVKVPKQKTIKFSGKVLGQKVQTDKMPKAPQGNMSKPPKQSYPKRNVLNSLK